MTEPIEATFVPRPHPHRKVKGVTPSDSPRPETWSLIGDELLCDGALRVRLADVTDVKTERVPIRRHRRAPATEYWRRLELVHGKRTTLSFRSAANDRPEDFFRLQQAIIERVAELTPAAKVRRAGITPGAGWVGWIVSLVIGWPAALNDDVGRQANGRYANPAFNLGFGILVLLVGLLLFGWWLANAGRPSERTAARHVQDAATPGRRHSNDSERRSQLVSLVVTSMLLVVYAIVLWTFRLS